jgi:zinc protease
MNVPNFKSNMKKIIANAFLALLWANVAFAQEKPLPFDTAVRTGRLPNGFTYFIRHNEEPKNRVILYLVNKVGSVLEDDDQQGLAHFVEHMSFNGTRHYPKNELVNYLQKSGVRFGADLNAYTSFNETVYQLPLPSDDPLILSNGIQIMRDWAQEATLDPVEIDKERGVVLEEKRLASGAEERMQRQYWPLVLNHSRYSIRKPIGVDSVLNSFKPETIRRFYQDWYRPDLQALIIVGDIDVDQMEKLVSAKFGDLKNPPKERERINYTTPLTGKNQFIVVTDPEQTQTALQVIIKQPALLIHTATQYKASLVRNLYNTMLAERFAELARQTNPPFLQGIAAINPFTIGLDNFAAGVVVKSGELEKGVKAVWREAERAKRNGFTSTELERTKQNLLSSWEAALKEKNKTPSGSYVNLYVQYFLNGTAAPGIDYEYKLATNDLAEITLHDVDQLAATTLKETDRDILIIAPEKEKKLLPDESTVLGWLKAVQMEDLQAYKDTFSKRSLFTTPPVPGKIIDESKDTVLHTTTLLLSNGVKVVLKPTTFNNDEIQFAGFSRGGTSLYSDADFQSAVNAVLIIPAFGVGNYDAGLLGKFLTGKRVAITLNMTDATQGISGSTVLKDLETALQLIYAYYTEPRKDSALFNSIIANSKAAMANRQDDPGSVFSDSVSAILYNANYRMTGPSIQKIDQIDLERVYRIYKERFADASGMTFTFVGNIDIQAIKPLLANYLGALPATHAMEKAKDLNIRITAGKIEKNIYKGKEPRATVQLVWSGKFDYTQPNKIELSALVECLQLRLLERLREEESGVYSPSAYVTTEKHPQNNEYALVVSFGCAPKNVDKLIASTWDEINKLKKEGPPTVNIDKWRTAMQRDLETSLQTNAFWLNYLYTHQVEERDMHLLTVYSNDLLKVTSATVKKAANQYFDDHNYIRLVLLPEKEKK